MPLDTVAARTRRRRLPSVDVPQTVDNDELRRSIEALKEHIRMYEGDSGAPKERFVTVEELELAGLIGTKVQGNFALIDQVLGGNVAQGQQSAQKIVFEGDGFGSGGGVEFLRDLRDTSVGGVKPGSVLYYQNGIWSYVDIGKIDNEFEVTQTFYNCVTFSDIDATTTATWCLDSDQTFAPDARTGTTLTFTQTGLEGLSIRAEQPVRIYQGTMAQDTPLLILGYEGINQQFRVLQVSESMSDDEALSPGAGAGFYIDYEGIPNSPDNTLHFGCDKPNAAGTIFHIGERGEFRIEDTGNNGASLTSINHPFQIGPTDSLNLRAGRNEIQAVLNGAQTELQIQPYGGGVSFFESDFGSDYHNFQIFLGKSGTTSGRFYLYSNSTNLNSFMYYGNTSGNDLIWTCGFTTENLDITGWDEVIFSSGQQVSWGNNDMSDAAQFKYGTVANEFATSFVDTINWTVSGLSGDMVHNNGIKMNVQTGRAFTIDGSIGVADATTPYFEMVNLGVNEDRRIFYWREEANNGFYFDLDFSNNNPDNALLFGTDIVGAVGEMLWMDQQGNWRWATDRFVYTYATRLLDAPGADLDFSDGSTVGDRINFFGTLDAAASTAIGNEGTNVLFYRAAGAHRWYLNTTADAGANNYLYLNVNELGLEKDIDFFQADAATATHSWRSSWNSPDYDWTFTGTTDLNITGLTDIVIGNYRLDISQTVGVSQDNYILTYDNATGKISLEAPGGGGGGGLDNVVEDTTPQLGGQLDVNGQALGDGTLELLTFTETASAVNHINLTNAATTNGPTVGAAGDDANIDLVLAAKGTGNITLGNFSFDADQTVGAGQDNYVLTYDNGTGLISLEVAPGAGQTPWTSDIDGGGFGLDNIDRLEIQAPAIPGDTATFTHDGTDFRTDFVNTNQWVIDNLDSGIIVRDETYAEVSTDVYTATNNYSNISAYYSANASTHAVQMGVSGNTAAYYPDTTWLFSNKELQIDGAGTYFRRTTGAGGALVRFYDSTDTDYAEFNHDGTDFNTTFVTTTDWNVTGLAGFNVGNYNFDVDQTVGAGQDNYVLTYDNATGLISLEVAPGAGGGISNVVEDTTPQLGGQLDVNGFGLGDGTLELLTFTETASAVNHINITNAITANGPTIGAAGDDANIDLVLAAKGTGNIDLGNFTFDADQTVGAGQDNYVLTYDNAGGTIQLEESIYDIGFFYSGKPTNSQEVFRMESVRAWTLPDPGTGSTGEARVASTGNVAFSVRRNGTQFATVTFNISASGTWAFDAATDENFAAGDTLTVLAPATADATLEDIAIFLKGFR